MNVPLEVLAAIFMAFAVLRGRQARRDWSALSGKWSGQRTIVGQVIILAGAALILSGDGAKPRSAARPGPEAFLLGVLGVAALLVGILITVFILGARKPRFLIPPQGRVVAGTQGGAVAVAAPGNAKSGRAAPPKAASGVSAAPSEDELLERAIGRQGPGAVKGARRLRKHVKEISLTVPMPPKQAVARTREIIDDLGSVASQDRVAAGSLQVVGVVEAGALNMNPAVVTVTISRSEEGSSVVVRGAAKEGLIKQHAGQDAAKRVAAELGAPRAD
ncbi:MAG TPA: hypothetical protein VMF87_03035 [Streptosporangiaceae bacterium]|nr:hypothetical protein [Streptosporangiaceae bacterium]